MDHRTTGPMPDRAMPPPLPPLYAEGARGQPPRPRESAAEDPVRERIDMLLREWRS